MLQLREIAAELLDDLLDERGAEVHAREPGLAVRDRIEHRGVGVVGVELGARVEQGRELARRAGGQRDLDEHERLVGHRGMEERVAAAIGVEAVLEVVPRADRVHRFVLDQLLEERGRRRPGEAAELEQADVEQQCELRPQLVADLGERRRVVGADLGIGREAELVGAGRRGTSRRRRGR